VSLAVESSGRLGRCSPTTFAAWLLPTESKPVFMGLFARVAEGSQACPLGPGLDWPGPNGAKHLVCVHGWNELGRAQIVFAAILGAGLEANYLQLPNWERVWQLAAVGLALRQK
jgi:hypothetical protein